MINFQFFHLKLFVILGLSWTMESVDFIIPEEFWPKFAWLCIFFGVIDSCNILRGFFFFIIFVCNKNTWTKIKQFCYLVYNPEPDVEMALEKTRLIVAMSYPNYFNVFLLLLLLMCLLMSFFQIWGILWMTLLLLLFLLCCVVVRKCLSDTPKDCVWSVMVYVQWCRPKIAQILTPVVVECWNNMLPDCNKIVMIVLKIEIQAGAFWCQKYAYQMWVESHYYN